MPLISVTMPVYNAERWVDESVQSIRDQTFRDLEFIIVDDGSTDRTRAVIERHASEDSRIRLVSRENRGIVATRNEALALAEGEFLAVMDADDAAFPERLEREVEYLQAHPECVAVGTPALFVDPQGKPLRTWWLRPEHEAIDRKHMACRGGAVLHPTAMIRRQVLVDVGGYRAPFEPAEDYDLFLRLAEVGRLANLPEPLLRYRQHLTSAGYAQRERQRRGAREACREAHVRRGLPWPEVPDHESRDRLALADHYGKWAWWALHDGYRATARKYAALTLRARPWAASSWRLAYCALRGR